MEADTGGGNIFPLASLYFCHREKYVPEIVRKHIFILNIKWFLWKVTVQTKDLEIQFMLHLSRLGKPDGLICPLRLCAVFAGQPLDSL